LRICDDEVIDEVLNLDTNVSRTNNEAIVLSNLIVDVLVIGEDALSGLLVRLDMVDIVSGIIVSLVEEGLVNRLVSRNNTGHLVNLGRELGRRAWKGADKTGVLWCAGTTLDLADSSLQFFPNVCEFVNEKSFSCFL
jgi:hypothetical protein